MLIFIFKPEDSYSIVTDMDGIFRGAHYHDTDFRSNNRRSNVDFLKLRPRRRGELYGGFYFALSNSFAEYFLVVAKEGEKKWQNDIKIVCKYQCLCK